MPGITITVNGTRREIQAAGDTPLLYVLRNDLELSGPQFGCGLSQCGSCSVLVDGKEARGFCQNGMMITATQLLEATPSPNVVQIKAAFTGGASPHLCRCGSYTAILDAVQRAATVMAKAR